MIDLDDIKNYRANMDIPETVTISKKSYDAMLSALCNYDCQEVLEALGLYNDQGDKGREFPSDTKPIVKIEDWSVENFSLLGQSEDHPRLGSTFVRTSMMLKVETLNTIYELGVPLSIVNAIEAMKAEEAMNEESEDASAD